MDVEDPYNESQLVGIQAKLIDGLILLVDNFPQPRKLYVDS